MLLIKALGECAEDEGVWKNPDTDESELKNDSGELNSVERSLRDNNQFISFVFSFLCMHNSNNFMYAQCDKNMSKS